MAAPLSALPALQDQQAAVPQRVLREAFFLPMGRSGSRFCVVRRPEAQDVRAWVVHVAPFAEEMNKARRMAALQAQAWAAQGYGVVQLDLQGTGDSDGELADASWDQWLDDLQAAAEWALARQDAPLIWWGVRTGCLLAAQVAPRWAVAGRFIFWQPVVSGASALTQFLRLKLAGEALAGQSRLTTQDLRAQLQGGQTLDIAGYELPPAVANGLGQASLTPPERVQSLVWLEVSSRSEPSLLPGSLPVLARWQAVADQVHQAAVGGPAFWQTVEIEDAPALIGASTDALSHGVAV